MSLPTGHGIALVDTRDPCGRCGHAKVAHEWHCHRVGTPEPTHCSQLCGCHAFVVTLGRQVVTR